MFTKKIALFISHIYGEYQKNLTQGVIDKALEHGYQTQVFTTNDGESLGELSNIEECILRLPVYSDLSGVIFASGTYASKDLRDRIKRALEKSGLPVIEVNDSSSSFPNVTMDNNSMFEVITDHFVSMHGAKRICYVGSLIESDISDIRLEHIKKAMAKNSLSFDEGDYYNCDETADDFERALDHLTMKGSSKPDAIICYNDRLALKLMIAADNKGYKIPDDFGISGCDNLAAGQNMIPALTTISYPVYDLGRIAVSNLNSIIRGRERSNTSVFAKVIYGGSCGCSYPLGKRAPMYTSSLLMQIADLENSIMMSSKMASAFGSASELEDMLDLIEEYVRQIASCSGFYLALSSSWSNLSDKILTLTASTDSINYEKGDDTLTLYFALQNGKRLPSCTFKNKTLLPDFLMSDNDKAQIVSPIYNHAGSIGYIVMTFENNRIKYPFKLIQYLVNLSQLLINIRNKKKSDAMATHLEEIYMKDELTGLYSSAGFDYYKNKNTTDDIEGYHRDLLVVETDSYDMIKENYGKEAADFAISVIGQAIKNSIPEGSIAGRINGGTFHILLNTDLDVADAVTKKILSYLDNYNRLNPKEYKIAASVT